jgi:hypothetical protein
VPVQQFSSRLSDSVEKGLGVLVDADLARESARLQSLQVKQQLGAQARVRVRHLVRHRARACNRRASALPNAATRARSAAAAALAAAQSSPSDAGQRATGAGRT